MESDYFWERSRNTRDGRGLSTRLRLCVLLIVQWNEDKAALFLEQEQEKQDALAAKASKDDD